MSLFEVENLDLFYGQTQALKEVNLKIEERAITAFIGPSGCGKSTFLRVLNRMNDLIGNVTTTGTVLFGGKNLYTEYEPMELRRRVGMVFQKPNPFPMSIFDNVAYGPRLFKRYNKSDISDLVEQSLRQSALWDDVKDRLHKSAMSLSGGQQQRLCLARTLATGPEVVLMDEPTSALDPISTARIEELMVSLKEQYTIVVVTHNMQQASRVSDDVAFFLVDEQRCGFLVEYGNTKDVFFNPRDKRTEDYISGKFG
ncbi:phosphate ABC transporter ATP-binding protein PstB [uncultured Sphaerochaeta sp.]|uniref:phosphate ABC transporter ATP-binding protein PstB n=1 Tax=uncultured Sphaerochaeta sp. TaxID=886478 RepID=UPI002A0A9919|nr:phosphate ABC transporter ATP-binding protein PstB [uncultured Sphaerochaeta sp.]